MVVNKKTFSQANALIVVLMLIAFVLGYLIYKQKAGTDTNTATESKVVGSKVQTSKREGENMRPTPQGLTDEEKQALNPPERNATNEEKSQHYNIVANLAEEADFLDINKCEKADPMVMSLKLKQDFKITNDDSVEHTLIIDEKTRYTIPPGKTITANANFQYGRGAYGYTCDKLGGVVGFFLVNP